MPQLGLFYILLAYFVIVGTGNAVNLTDGLDGLAIMPTVFVAGGFALVAWATGNMNFASYLHIPYLGQDWASCGLTPIRRRSLWAM